MTPDPTASGDAGDKAAGAPGPPRPGDREPSRSETLEAELAALEAILPDESPAKERAVEKPVVDDTREAEG